MHCNKEIENYCFTTWDLSTFSKKSIRSQGSKKFGAPSIVGAASSERILKPLQEKIQTGFQKNMDVFETRLVPQRGIRSGKIFALSCTFRPDGWSIWGHPGGPHQLEPLTHSPPAP